MSTSWQVTEACHVEAQGPHRRVVLDLAAGEFAPADADEAAALAVVAAAGHAHPAVPAPPVVAEPAQPVPDPPAAVAPVEILPTT